MTAILRVEHPVGDFERWRHAFDSDPEDRERSGVRRYRVMRACEDPNYVLIDLESTHRRRRRCSRPGYGNCGVAST